MDACKICSNDLHGSPDHLVLCEHKGGMVHIGCCTGLCSLDRQPCRHSKALYSKVR